MALLSALPSRGAAPSASRPPTVTAPGRLAPRKPGGTDRQCDGHQTPLVYHGCRFHPSWNSSALGRVPELDPKKLQSNQTLTICGSTRTLGWKSGPAKPRPVLAALHRRKERFAGEIHHGSGTATCHHWRMIRRYAWAMGTMAICVGLWSCGGQSSAGDTQKATGEGNDESKPTSKDDGSRSPESRPDGGGSSETRPVETTPSTPNGTTPEGPASQPPAPLASEPAEPTPKPADRPVVPGAQPSSSAAPDPTPRPECPGACAVSAICNLCDDGSCAVPSVSCNDDGSCGSTTWTCPEGQPAQPSEPGPVPTFDPAPASSNWEMPCEGKACGDPCNSCPPDAVCLVGPGLCDARGACVQVDPACSESGTTPGCITDSECSAPAGCVKCSNGAEWCPEPRCVEGVCGTSPNLCPEGYQPCAGHEDGDTCTECSPLDDECVEPAGTRICDEGSCILVTAR